MTLNYLIGIGGTGSKCLEAFLHTAAAGMAPPQVTLGFVDQDRANGNLSRAKDTLSRYQALRRELRADSHILSRACPLAGTQIILPPGDPVWTPVQESQKFRDVVDERNMRDDERVLLDGFFDEHEELEMQLDRGFRGRPAVGAATILSKVMDGGPFWQRLLEGTARVREGEEVRIFLIGSIFGGTGAAGFPSIARLIREELKRKRITRNVYIGGLLLLPYFSFPDDPGSSTVAVKSEQLLGQAHSALRYYHRMLQPTTGQARVFDSFYVLGWQPLMRLGYNKDGGNEQVNPPLIPELYAGLAACHFFRIDKQSLPQSRSESAYVQLVGRDQAGTLTWNDIPSPDPKNDAEPVQRFGQLLRFALLDRYIYGELLRNGNSGSIRWEWWYRRLLHDQNVNLEHEETKNSLEAVRRYNDAFLTWFYTMCFASRTSNFGVDLIDVKRLAKTPDEREILSQVEPLTSLPGATEKFFPALVYSQTGKPLHAIREQLLYAKPDEDATGLGAFYSELFAASARAADAPAS